MKLLGVQNSEFTRKAILARLGLGCLLLMFCVPSIVQTSVAQTLADADAVIEQRPHDAVENKAVIKAWIEPSEEIIVSQQINLHIEVATPQWFTGGTRIGALEVDDLVVLRREKFAVNSTRDIDDQTWTVQLWTMTLYPQRDGEFLIPPIELRLSVANEQSESIKVRMETAPISFVASTPNELITRKKKSTESDFDWLATTRFDLSEQYDTPLTGLKIGNSVKRVIDISSENVAAMMLPQIQFEPIVGLAIYPDAPKIIDRVNRGEYLASRQQTVTYVVEKQGTYVLPQLEFYWWDLGSQSLQHEVLPEQFLSTEETVVGFVRVQAEVEPLPANLLSIDDRAVLSVLAFVLLLAGAGWWKKRLRSKLSTCANRLSHVALQKAYIASCRAGDYQHASRVFFKWLDPYLELSERVCNDFSVRKFLRSINALRALNLFDQLMVAAHCPVRDEKNANKELEKLPAELKKVALSKRKYEQPANLSEFPLN